MEYIVKFNVTKHEQTVSYDREWHESIPFPEVPNNTLVEVVNSPTKMYETSYSSWYVKLGEIWICVNPLTQIEER